MFSKVYNIYRLLSADVAQLVEQRIENPCVTGSNPVFGTKQMEQLAESA